ncbi:hypothetical protein GGX14DRAFT_556839 [Mycena pura]|uniref:Uncharacterized protein n=1 Tax=Mycena pura TaxID=153505 RepID=A0AAD6YR54_9AGAR|nr:hypothetical protein GGX14DRAFT_556839 [Mycena pura]
MDLPTPSTCGPGGASGKCPPRLIRSKLSLRPVSQLAGILYAHAHPDSDLRALSVLTLFVTMTFQFYVCIYAQNPGTMFQYDLMLCPREI